MILSVQSSVCYGCVGNNAATVPLLLLGHRINTIHTVFFSNHTGYPSVKGFKLTGDQFKDIILGLEENGLLSQYTTILSGECSFILLTLGYVGNESTLIALQTTLQDLKLKNPKLLFVLDPVMGDNDYMYVPKELIPVYIAMLPLADVITPNLFELQLLTNTTINTVKDARAALAITHSLGVRFSVLTSMPMPNDTLLLIASMQQNTSPPIQFSLQFPKVRQNFTGTGDTFTALLLGYLLGTDFSFSAFKSACEKAVSVVHCIICETFRGMLEGASEEAFEMLPKAVKMKRRELDAMGCRGMIESPDVKFIATVLE
jgi:pyridoxine kinase